MSECIAHVEMGRISKEGDIYSRKCVPRKYVLGRTNFFEEILTGSSGTIDVHLYEDKVHYRTDAVEMREIGDDYYYTQNYIHVLLYLFICLSDGFYAVDWEIPVFCHSWEVN